MKAREIVSSIKILALATILAFGMTYVYAWTAAPSSPPNGNVSAPLNVGATAQTKSGSLTASQFTAPTYCIGTSCISAWPAAGGGGTGGTIKAWFSWKAGPSYYGNPGYFLNSNGVSSVTRPDPYGDPARYDFHFSQPMTSVNYGVICNRPATLPYGSFPDVRVRSKTVNYLSLDLSDNMYYSNTSALVDCMIAGN